MRVGLAALLLTGSAGADVRSAGIRRAAHAAAEFRGTPAAVIDGAVSAALQVEREFNDPLITAPLLLALAWFESNFENDAPPLCGVMQVSPRSLDMRGSEAEARCELWTSSMLEGFRAGALELHKLLRERPEARMTCGSLWRALQYRACGSMIFAPHDRCWRQLRCGKDPWIKRSMRLAARLSAPPFTLD